MYEELRQFIGILVRYGETKQRNDKVAAPPVQIVTQYDNSLKWLGELQTKSFNVTTQDENLLKPKYQNKL